MRLKIEEAFYSKRGGHQGEPTIRVASRVEMLMELWVTGDTYERAAPLIEALRTGRISRTRYETLKSILVANALATGQVDETDAILVAIHYMWLACPARLLPDLRPLRLKILGWLDRRLDRKIDSDDPPPA